MNTIRVSNVITKDEINKWKDGSIITIQAGTGAGKSYFIKNRLYDHAKKQGKRILFLIHRRNCINQFKMEIERDNKTDIIDIRTYQSLEHLYNMNKYIPLDDYQYIVCDEFHYFMSDSSFNIFTDISLRLILEQANTTRIFMSATGDSVKRYIGNYLKHDIISYEIPTNYDFIQSLSFYNSDDALDTIIKQYIDQNNKCIFFIQSAEKAYNLYRRYENYSLFNCGKSDKHYKYVDENKINQMLQKEKFNELILITTTCMDAGVNIIDTELTHIVCDVKDIGTLIQCIGRKRIQSKSDKLHLIIKNISNKQLNGMIRKNSERIEKATYLRTHSQQEYILKYPRDYDTSYIVYNDIVMDNRDAAALKVNEIMLFKCLIDTSIMEMMIKEEFGYCKHIARLFGFYDEEDHYYNYIVIDKEQRKLKLNEYLESITGKKLYKDEQKELIDMIDLRVNGRQQRSFKKLNDGLEMLKLPYVILNNVDNRRKLDDGSDNPNRNKTYWTVMESLT